MSKLHRYSRLVVKEGSPLVIHDKKHKMSYVVKKSGNRRIVYRVNDDDTLTMIKKPAWLNLPKPKKTKKAKPKPKPKKKPKKETKLEERRRRIKEAYTMHKLSADDLKEMIKNEEKLIKRYERVIEIVKSKKRKASAVGKWDHHNERDFLEYIRQANMKIFGRKQTIEHLRKDIEKLEGLKIDYPIPLPPVEAEPVAVPVEAPFEGIPPKGTTPQYIEHIKQFGTARARTRLGTFEKYWRHYKDALKRARKKKDKEAIRENKAKVVEYQKKIASLVGTGMYGDVCGGFADLNTGYIKSGGRIDPLDDIYPIDHLYHFEPHRPHLSHFYYPQIQ